MATDIKDLDISLLDVSLDDIETLPGFDTPFPGVYLLKMTTGLKKVQDSTCVETAFEVLETVKMDNDSDPQPVIGSKFSNIYTIISGKTDSEKKLEAERLGKGKLKELLLDVAEKTGQGNLMVLVRDVLASCVVQATVTRRQDREDKEKYYPVVKNLTLQ